MSKSIAKTAKKTKINTNNDVFLFVKALIISLIITFVCIIIFALIIKMENLNDRVIAPVNLVIKGISIAVGTLIFTKNKVGGLKKGLIFAASYITLAFVIFSLLSTSFNLSVGLILDYVFGMIIAGVIGVIRVNKKSKV